MGFLLRIRRTAEDGQDMVEYSLLLAFIVVVSAALFLYNSGSVAVIWTVTANALSAANSMATTR